MKLKSQQYYIRFQSDFGNESFISSLQFVTDIDAVISNWTASTRISPVWQLVPNADPVPLPEECTHAWVLFLSAADPAMLSEHLTNTCLGKLNNSNLWISLGSYNIIAVSYEKEVTEELTDFCHDKDIEIECWEIDEFDEHGEFLVDNIKTSNPQDYSITGPGDTTSPIKKNELKNLFPNDDTLRSMALEFYALYSVVRTRSQPNFPEFGDDVVDLEQLARSILFQNGGTANGPTAEVASIVDDGKKRDLLLTLNAGLARLSSQALSGTTPISMTECHFWPHSLLGTGIANVALRNVANFVTNAVKKSQFNSTYYQVLDLPFELDKNKIRERQVDWGQHFNIEFEVIFSANFQERIKKLKEGQTKEDMVANPITYFSGRDGFRNGFFTTSAPLMAVSGANSFHWNLGTITHELSHRIISGKLEELFAGVLGFFDEKDASVDDFIQRKPETLGEFAQQLVALQLLILHAKAFPDDNEIILAMEDGASFLTDAKVDYSEDIEELLVHVFDFYHFYGGQAKTFIDFVWLSWAVQPSIKEKLHEYILRTLTALSVSYFGNKNWIERAYADFEVILSQEPLASKLPSDLKTEVMEFIGKAKKQKQASWYLELMEALLTLFHYHFKSADLREICTEDPYRSPRKLHDQQYNYTAARRVFVSEDATDVLPTFSNPLLFLRDFSREIEPNASHSAWLFHLLAFNAYSDLAEEPS